MIGFNTRALAVATLLLAGCAHQIRKFPDADPMWVDADERHVDKKPASYWSGLAWDGVDQSLFRPINRGLGLVIGSPAANVNAWDEVPNSSWFHNRIGVHSMTAEELRNGSCPEDLLDPAGPWTVTAAKPNGANPGFIIKDQQGRGWLLKMDGLDQPERATTADVFGSKLYHAAGFHAPCNIVVFFDRDVFVMSPEAETEDRLGRDIPMTMEDVEKVLAAAGVQPDGRLRSSASLFLSGRPIGPWTYQERRKDDPNDVINHQDRRELRGAALLAAWTNHFDAREQNTLAMWVEEDGRTFVRHYYIDFGDTFGAIWEENPLSLSMRFGRSYYFDATDVMVDYLTLGTITREWEVVEQREIAPIFGYFDAAHFDPEHYKPGYPNPSFLRMNDEDGAWMARIIARFNDDAIRAMLDTGRMSNPIYEAELLRILIARRDRILHSYLRVRSPLADFRVKGDQVCFTDLAAATGILDTRTVRYESRMYYAPYSEPAWTRTENPVGPTDPSELCVDLRADGVDPGKYAVLDLLVHEIPGAEPIPPARLHFYDHGMEGFRLAGIERPGSDRAPSSK